jgi:hypothetical protein
LPVFHSYQQVNHAFKSASLKQDACSSIYFSICHRKKVGHAAGLL